MVAGSERLHAGLYSDFSILLKCQKSTPHIFKWGVDACRVGTDIFVCTCGHRRITLELTFSKAWFMRV